jgi:hypothetical protein
VFPEELQPVSKEARGQEVGPDVLLAGASEALAEIGLAQDAQ